MSRTKKFILLATTFCLSLMLALCFCFSNASSAVFGENGPLRSTNYSLHLEDLNTTSTSAETKIIRTINNNPIHLSVKKFSNKTFAKNAIISNDDPINGLTSITVSFSGSTGRLVVNYGWFEYDLHYTGEITPENNVYNFDGYSPSYFSLMNTGSAFSVNQIILRYSCSPGALPDEYTMINYTRDGDTYYVSGYVEGITDGIITKTHNGLPVTHVADEAFDNCETLKSIKITYGVTSIGEGAFFYNTSLESVTLPNSITSIGPSAFAMCSSLTSITLPVSLTTIQSYCFAQCPLQTITIPSSVTTIGASAFESCNSLVSVSLPTKCTVIGELAFRYCPSLASINLLNVSVIGRYAFYEDHALQEVIIGDNVKKIRSHCFYNCYSLSSVTIGSSVEEIETNAFFLCPELKTVINRSSLNIQAGSTSYGYVGYYATSIVQS